ncbi:EF-hand domain-containing member C2, partial [Physocladia obscura]
GIPLFGQEETKIHTSVETYPHSSALGEGVPAWVAFDRKVLRFYAYFQEAVHEKREEQYRIRRCNIYFYLEDDTIHVSEPKYANSGIPQGTLIKRHRIQKSSDSNGQHYVVADLNVGKEITLYCKTFKIVGCDDFSREFLTALGITVPESGKFPADPYQVRRQELLSRMKPTRPYEPKSSLKKFLENDRHVLRFYCVWDDTPSVFGDARHMVVHYYLSDDTVEIREAIPANAGREKNTLFLRRGRLPKHKQRFEYGQQDAKQSPDEFFSDRDLTIGAVLHLYGRPFVICDCDEFTKSYYREKYGLEQFDPVSLDDYEEELFSEGDALVAAAYQQKEPVQPMIGSHDTPKKDSKMIQFDGVVLRFLAVLQTSKQVDADRKFVISMHPVDGSVSVFEPHQRNAGIMGGKFLEKGKIKKPDGENFYEASDFYLGAQLLFHRHPFVITDADNYAKAFIEEHPEIWKKQG